MSVGWWQAARVEGANARNDKAGARPARTSCDDCAYIAVFRAKSNTLYFQWLTEGGLETSRAEIAVIYQTLIGNVLVLVGRAVYGV
jgi:hypothetical protein